jgi:HD-GYP domain-containing protein (c-di-GMP phosphodiesterase class II)
MDLILLENMTHYEHSKKVSQISGLIAASAGFGPDEVRIIKQAALCHDIVRP